MHEEYGDMFDMKADWHCITTNGYVRKDGCLVMGRGCAHEAKTLYPELPLYLGQRVQRDGNSVHSVVARKIITFPVKHNWNEQADLDLIAKSMEELIAYHGSFDLGRVLLPRPGCGNGGLDWENDVKPVLSQLDIPDGIVIVTYAPAKEVAAV